MIEDQDKNAIVSYDDLLKVKPVQVLKDMGGKADASSFNQIFDEFKDITEQEVGQMVAMMAHNHKEEWDVCAFADTVKARIPEMNSQKLMSLIPLLDSDPQVGECLFKILKKLTTVPLQDLLLSASGWKGMDAPRFGLLKLAMDQKDIIPTGNGELSFVGNDTVWANSQVVEALVILSQNEEVKDEVALLFKEPEEKYQAILFVMLCRSDGITQIPLYEELMNALVLSFFDNPAGDLNQAMKFSAIRVKQSLQSLWSQKKLDLNRILSVLLQENMKEVFFLILKEEPNIFTFEVAHLACQRQFLNLTQWLKDSLMAHRDACFVACMSFLKLSGKNLPKEMLGQYIKGLQSCNSLSQENMTTLAHFINQCCMHYPSLMDTGAVEPRQVAGQQPVAASQEYHHAPRTQQAAESRKAILRAQQLVPEVLDPNASLEDVSNKFFSKIYTKSMTVNELISVMKEYINMDKESREYEVYSCMIRNLFDECRFFPKYPLAELVVTGELFGNLIKHNLVSAMTLGLALRCVLESLRRPITSKMFSFGLLALEQFMGQLSTWPQFCKHLAQIPHLADQYPTYHAYFQGIYDALPPQIQEQQSVESRIFQQLNLKLPAPPKIVPNYQLEESLGDYAGGPPGMNVPAPQLNPNPMPAPGLAVQQLGTGAADLRKANASVDELLRDPELLQHVVQPPPPIVDFISQIFNSLVKENMDMKARDINERLDPAYWPWLAYTIIKTRASKEVNMHSTYLEWLDRTDPKLQEMVTSVTYDVLRVLLRAVDQTVNSTSHRTVLKNLGYWLGQITLARNKPFKSKQLDLKSMLVDAYENGRLTAVLPLVAKIMEGVKDSKVYKLPNPWTVAILSLLAEIHDVPNLRTNLMFEVEVLCKHLEIDLNQIQRSCHLKGVSTAKNTIDFSKKKPGPEPEGMGFQNPAEDSHQSPQQFQAQLQHILQQDHSHNAGQQLLQQLQRGGDGMMPNVGAGVGGMPTAPKLPQEPPVKEKKELELNINIGPQIVISSSIALFQLQPGLRNLVIVAVDRAIKEIISAVMERSVNISCITTRQIVLKDFRNEPDDNVLRRAAQIMMSSLAPSFALATCREPLRISIVNHLRSLLIVAGLSTEKNDHALIEQVVQIVAADNLEMSCGVVEKIVFDKALANVDEQMTMYLQNRDLNTPKGYELPPFLDPTSSIHKLNAYQKMTSLNC